MSRRVVELKVIKNKIGKIINEPVFLMKDIVQMLSVLDCKSAESKAREALKNAKILPKQFALKCSHANNTVCFYRLADVWKLFELLNVKGLINLLAEELTKPEDLVQFEIEVTSRERQTVGFIPKKSHRDSLLGEGIWDNAVKAIEG
jgi:hypothetical protein